MSTIIKASLLLACVCGIIHGLKVDINLDQVRAQVEPEFLSFNIDTEQLSPPKWQTFDFRSPRVQTLMKGLSPAYLRFGGSSADWVVFSDEPVQVFEKSGASPLLHTYNTTDIDNLANLVRSANVKFLMDLNLQVRYGQQWDPTNAAKLLGYIKKMKYQDVFNFEMGNEPSEYGSTPGTVGLNGTRIGQDFAILRQLLSQYNMTNVTVVGPDCVTIGTLFKEFIEEAGHLLTAATFHHYYFNGNVSGLSDYIDAKHFKAYEASVHNVQTIIRKSKTPSLNLWMGEGADGWHHGTYNISDRYVDGFLWLDKLGVSAKEGMGVVMRQTFYGGYYAFIDANLMPNPDYWLSYLHKQLVGQKVLNVTTTNTTTEPDTTLYWQSFWNWTGTSSDDTDDEVRVYAHCTKPSTKYKAGSITVFALSVQKSGYETLTFPAPLSSQTVHIYMLTPVGPDGITSKQVALNGKTLELIDDHTLPQLVPVQQSASRGIKLAALTFGFFVFPDANAAACK